MKHKFIMTSTLIFLLSFFVIFTACGGVKNVTLSTDTCEIVEDDTYQLSYSVFPEDANTEELKWTSVDENIAVVDATGKITAISAGQTNITIANDKEMLATCSVIVLPKPAYEKLSDDEKAFVDCFVSNIYIFNNPESVVVNGIGFISTDDDDSVDDFWEVEVSAKNNLGQTSTDYFLLSPSVFTKSDIAGLVSGYDPNYRLDLINEAIAEKR